MQPKIDERASVTDSFDGGPATPIGAASYLWSDVWKAPDHRVVVATYSSPAVGGPAGACRDYDNLARVDESDTDDFDTSEQTVEVCVDLDDLIVSKTAKPAFARDVAALVRVELARRAGGRMLFDAATLPPVQLLRGLLSCPRSGRLLLVSGRAEIRFRAGKIIDARFDTMGGNVDTVVRSLALTTGHYELVLEPVNGFAELQCGLREVVELVVPLQG